jgi:hypothetical protein
VLEGEGEGHRAHLDFRLVPAATRSTRGCGRHADRCARDAHRLRLRARRRGLASPVGVDLRCKQRRYLYVSAARAGRRWAPVAARASCAGRRSARRTPIAWAAARHLPTWWAWAVCSSCGSRRGRRLGSPAPFAPLRRWRGVIDTGGKRSNGGRSPRKTALLVQPLQCAVALGHHKNVLARVLDAAFGRHRVALARGTPAKFRPSNRRPRANEF